MKKVILVVLFSVFYSFLNNRFSSQIFCFKLTECTISIRPIDSSFSKMYVFEKLTCDTK